MQLKKLLIYVCIVALVSTVFSGCILKRYHVTHPSDQKNTFWSTEDGSVYFSVDDTASSPVYGYIDTPDGPVEIAIYMSELTSVVEVAYAEDARNLKKDEVIPSFAVWSTTDYDETHIVMTVVETKYLEAGKELIFYRQ